MLNYVLIRNFFVFSVLYTWIDDYTHLNALVPYRLFFINDSSIYHG